MTRSHAIGGARSRDTASSDDEDCDSSDISDMPKFFYGRSADSVATGNDRQMQTDDVGSSRVSRGTPVNGMIFIYCAANIFA